MASAADMGPETVSLPASSSDTATETVSPPANASNTSTESVSPAAGTPETSTETALPSADDSVAPPKEFSVEPNDSHDTNESEPQEPGPEDTVPVPLPKTNMVAHEVLIKVTGARPGNTLGERELFAEETSTVLVFEKGGVIRLSAAVTPGQLLFLTNVESKREVVAQVSRKRTYKPTSCFVEVEFTEPAPRFWGMEFSAAMALLPKAAQDVQAAALVVAAETTADAPGDPIAAPTAEQVVEWKREVEVLRTRPQTPEPALPAEPLLMHANEPAPTPASDSLPAPIVVEVPQAEAQWSAGSEAASSDAFTARSLPLEHDPVPAQLTAAEQALLPTPSLDFSKSLPKHKRSLRARGNFTPSFRAGALRLALLTVALVVTMVGAAWYKHWIPWNLVAKKSTGSAVSKPLSAKPVTVPGGQTTAGTDTENGSTKLVSDLPVTSPAGTTSHPASASVPDKTPTDGPDNTSQPATSTESAVQPETAEKPVSRAPAAKRTSTHPVTKPTADPVTSSAEVGEIVPPKLIKSVRAVASLEDLRDFERGNVTIDAVVDTQGEVKSINVLSGPPSLREPAAAAFRQFQYEPATRNGKPVPAHVTVTIHFRFEP